MTEEEFLDTLLEEEKLFIDLQNAKNKGIEIDDGKEIPSDEKFHSDYMKGSVKPLPENKIAGAVTNFIGAIGDFVDDFNITENLDKLIDLDKYTVKIPVNLGDFVKRQKINPEDRVGFEKVTGANYRYDFDKDRVETVEVNLKDILMSIDPSDVLGLRAAERIAKGTEERIGAVPKVSPGAGRDIDPEDILETGFSAVPFAGAGVVKGGKLAAKELAPKAKEMAQSALEKTEDVLGTKAFAAPKQGDLFESNNMIGTAIPDTVNRDVVDKNNVVKFDSFVDDDEKRSQNLQLLNLSPSIKITDESKESSRQIVDQLKDNLRFVYENTSDEIKNNAKQWYDGANKIAKDISNKYSLNDAQSSAIIAALSPKKDWNENVSLAERTVDILKNKTNLSLDKKATAKIKQLYNPTQDVYYKIQYGTTKRGFPAKKEKKELETRINAKLAGLSFEDIDNMDFKDLNPEQIENRKTALKALMVRIIDETYNDRSYKLVNPDGSFGDVAKTDKGANAKAAWQNYNAIGSAVKIFEDSSLENINVTVGDGHKVRSFYNNIVNPDADDIVTIDTHAVSAAHLRPLGANDLEPSNAFGQQITGLKSPAQNATTGEKGTYSYYQQAYNEVAKEYGLLGRQMQSIIWEGIRDFFPKTFKNKTTKSFIDNIWTNWKNGKISAEEARQQIVDYRNKNIGGEGE